MNGVLFNLFFYKELPPFWALVSKKNFRGSPPAKYQLEPLPEIKDFDPPTGGG